MSKRTLGLVVREARQDHAMTQRELAKLVGVKGSHIAYIEGNRRKPSLSLLRRIADVLGLDRRELLFLTHPEARQLVGESDGAGSAMPTDSWRRFAANRALHKRHRITARELKLLKQVSLLQRVNFPGHFIFVLNSIRQAGAPRD
jgi:transcriptional regulator with XRE-family HTH domain